MSGLPLAHGQLLSGYTLGEKCLSFSQYLLVAIHSMALGVIPALRFGVSRAHTGFVHVLSIALSSYVQLCYSVLVFTCLFD